jgi:hypothetical protein
MGAHTRCAVPRVNERFIGEPLEPVTATFDANRMASGEPGLPREFTWKGERFRVVSVRRAWRETGPCHHGSGELYLRKHWFEIEDDQGRVLKLYFERQARGRQKSARWHLFTMSGAPTGT